MDIIQLISQVVFSGNRLATQGLQAIDTGDFDRAADKLSKAISRNPTRFDLAELYTVLGKAYERTDRFEEAIGACEKAIEINPKCYRAWNILAIAYYYSGDFEKAEKCYGKAIDINPRYAFAYAGLGGLYLDKDEPHKAIEILKKAIELNPRIDVAHSNIALAYAGAGDFAGAKASLKRAIALGYRNWEEIQYRIESLRAFEQIDADADEIIPTTLEHLPPYCPYCNTPVILSDLARDNVIPVHCPTCGKSLTPPVSD